MSLTGIPAPQETVYLLEAEPVENSLSHGTYIIPITDITIETNNGAALDAVRYEHWVVSIYQKAQYGHCVGL